MGGSAQPSSVAASLEYRPRREYHQHTVPEPCPATPTALFEGRYDGGVTANLSYDLAPKGDRFLMIQPLGERTTRSFRVVLNWFDDVRRLSPVE